MPLDGSASPSKHLTWKAPVQMTMSTLSHLSSTDLERLLPMADAIAAVERAIEAGIAEPPPRAHLAVAGGELLLMPAESVQGVGVKLVTINRANPGRGLPLIAGLYVLFDGDTLAPRLTIDGASLTALRTAAVSALATSRLALPDARRLVLFGAGRQARAHLDAMRAVRSIESVVVVDADRGRADALAAYARDEGIDARSGVPEDVSEADLICTCTTSTAPVFPGALLPAGAHVNAIGAYRPDARELDDETMRRAKVVVESDQAALAEAGDLVIPLQSGALDRSAILADLPQLVNGAVVRRGADEITVFKSVGVAWEDLAVAAAAAAAALASSSSAPAAG
jgi:ornithine cyclodeaminase/alanine dehydrogenase-like protein (mu-crystallin family)